MKQRAAAKAKGEENLVLFSEQDLSLNEVAFDEMNIVELPFALLTRNTDGIFEIPLSVDGKSTLACLNSSKYGLPNSLAPRVLLGLMWLWRSEHSDDEQTFTFKVRTLVRRYMYPERFKSYPPNSELLRSVERQINCIANSRIHTDRWWDHELRKKEAVNISIIGDVAVLEEGGRNRSRMLRITWGQSFWKSMVHRYTKPIDARLIQSLERPLDLQLYRLLDRQLRSKKTQRYANIIDFARFKLGMQGVTLDSGGRTASSYVAKKLGESLKRLSREQFTVRMTIDRSIDPYSITFERIHGRRGQPHEVRDDDLPRDLIREFRFHAHSIPRSQKLARISKADRAKAKEWVDIYGYVKAKWMVKHCVRLQRQQGREPIMVFNGLPFYEGAAAGAYEQSVAERAGQQQLIFEETCERLWDAYQQRLVEAFDSQASSEQLRELEADTLRQVRAGSKAPRMGALSKEEFQEQMRALGTRKALRDALAKRHGFDALPAP